MKNFYPPEEIIGNIANAYRRNHNFDESCFNIIQNNRDFLRKYLIWVDNTKTIKDYQKTTEDFIAKWNEQKNFAYIITDKKNQPVGSIDIQGVDLFNKNVKIGYFLSKDATGNGYVSDILQHIEDIIFKNGFVRIQITCARDNIESNNVAIRNGYTLEGTQKKSLNIHDIFHDNNIYAKIK